MKQTFLLLASIALVALLASGVALALELNVVKCEAGKPCNGTNKADRIAGTSSADRINGRGGADNINGRSGADKIVDDPAGLEASEGFVDKLSGGIGSDKLTGRAGSDQLRGGVGRTFSSANNLVTDDTLIDVGGAGSTLQDATNERYVFDRPLGVDLIADRYGRERADLTAYTSNDIVESYADDGDQNGNPDFLVIILAEANGKRSALLILDYFNNKPNQGRGRGYIEAILFSQARLSSQSISRDAAIKTDASDNSKLEARIQEVVEAARSVSEEVEN